MPIRPENRGRYPAEWKQIRERILQRAKWRCEDCGVANHAIGWRDGAGFNELGEHEAPPDGFKAIKIVLTIAHLDHTPENCADDNLRAWCQRCHNAYDAAMRQAGRKARARAATPDLFERKDPRP